MGMVRSLSAALVTALCLNSPVGPKLAFAGSIVTAKFRIDYQDISDKQAADLGRYFEKALESVTGFLGKKSTRRLTVSISDQHFYPHFEPVRGIIVIPANRIRGGANGPPAFRNRGPSIADAITVAVTAPGNRRYGPFLQTGLAIYMQERFGAKHDRAYPAMGKDIHDETAMAARRAGRLISLSEVEKVRTKRQRLIGPRHLAYLQEGSFVRFLIEEWGIERFLAVFDGKDFHDVYRKSFSQLEKIWAERILSRWAAADGDR